MNSSLRFSFRFTHVPGRAPGTYSESFFFGFTDELAPGGDGENHFVAALAHPFGLREDANLLSAPTI